MKQYIVVWHFNHTNIRHSSYVFASNIHEAADKIKDDLYSKMDVHIESVDEIKDETI